MSSESSYVVTTLKSRGFEVSDDNLKQEPVNVSVKILELFIDHENNKDYQKLLGESPKFSDVFNLLGIVITADTSTMDLKQQLNDILFATEQLSPPHFINAISPFTNLILTDFYHGSFNKELYFNLTSEESNPVVLQLVESVHGENDWDAWLEIKSDRVMKQSSKVASSTYHLAAESTRAGVSWLGTTSAWQQGVSFFSTHLTTTEQLAQLSCTVLPTTEEKGLTQPPS